MAGTEAAVRGNEAMSRRAWEEARDAFLAADSEGELRAGDLEQLAEAWWWVGDPDAAVEAWERAFSGRVESGEKGSAAVVALRLAELAFRRGAVAVGGGWITRAEHLLADEPPSAAHGWLAAQRSALAMLVHGDPQAAEVHARQALELAREHHDRELEALALGVFGTAVVRQGRWVEGMAMIDEAAAAAGSGELAPKTACDVYCITIATCCEASDYKRAAEWTEQVDRWMERHQIRGYRGECRLHRAELKRRQGAWSEAEREARDASRELEGFKLMDSAGLANYEIGEIRLRMGDLDGAEKSFAAAYELGREPFPGLALVMLARGDIEGAATAMRRLLEAGAFLSDGLHSSGDLLVRSLVLPAAVEVLVAAGDTERAREAGDELNEIAATYESATLEAAARLGLGSVALAEGRLTEAIAELEHSWRLWRRAESPYEAARARMLLGEARMAAGDESIARRDLTAARSEFARLGARLDLEKLDGVLGEPAPEPESRVERAFLFTDIVASTEIIDMIGDDAWSDLLAWHDRLLREELDHHQGEIVKHTGDGFFAAFDHAVDAVRCSVSIQQRLAAHRREHGFAPRVRMGIHAAEARRAGSDYAGQAVHVAARVAALAGGGEILVSAAVADAVKALGLDFSEGQPTSLKGVRELVEVRQLRWRR